LHGHYGEDGQVQSLLDQLGHKYTGSGKVVSAMAYNKHLAKQSLERSGLRVPKGVSVNTKHDPYEVAHKLFNTIGGQYVIKPLRGTASEGVRVVRSQTELANAIIQALWADGEILVEELIRGREVKMGIVDGLRGDDLYVLLPVEVIRDGQTNVYLPLGGNNFKIPGNFSITEKNILAETARLAHKTLGARGYSMTDIILTSRGPIVIELDTHPELGPESPMHESLKALGVTPAEFLDHVIEYA
jgi:D-alanine-D-alanine ligase